MKRITLRQARKRRGLSQVQLAKAASMDQTSISKLEVGKVLDPSFETVVRLAAALDIDPRTLKFGVHEVAS